MDMSDNLAAQQADELERDRERLREEGAEQRLHDHLGHSVSTVGRKLKLMFGAGAEHQLELAADGGHRMAEVVVQALLRPFLSQAFAIALEFVRLLGGEVIRHVHA